MSKPSLRRLTSELWSADALVRAEAARLLNTQAIADATDIRTAFPALVWCLRDPSAEVRRAALETLEGCAAMGRDVAMAVPMCVELTHDESADMRLLAWSVLGAAHRRRPIFKELEALIAEGGKDPDERVAQRVKNLGDRP